MLRFKINDASSYHAIGLDISDGSVELMNINTQNNGNQYIQEYGRIEITDDCIVNGIIRNEKALLHAISTLATRTKIDLTNTSIISALPDAQIVMKTIPIRSDARMSKSYLHSLACKSVDSLKLTLRRPIMTWQFLPKNPQTGELVVYVTEQLYVDQWKRFFAKLGTSLIVIEMESHALARSLIKRCHPHEKIGILDFGYRHTTFTITDIHGIRYNHAIDIGGHQITTMLASQMQCSIKDAEKLKKTHGVSNTGREDISRFTQTKIRHILHSLSIRQLNTHYHFSKILLTGGGALLPGIKAYCSHYLALNTVRGELCIQPLQQKNLNLTRFPLSIPEQQLYAGVAGLALRGSDATTLHQGINFITATQIN